MDATPASPIEPPPAAAAAAAGQGITGRIRRASVSVINANPQLGMWQAAGTAIAQAPNLTELREPESGGANIEFNAHGHSARTAAQEPNGDLALVKSLTRVQTALVREEAGDGDGDGDEPRMMAPRDRRKSLAELHAAEEKAGWGTTILNGLKAFWKFFRTPSGFVITIYFLNIVAWGAMLFFLLLSAAPAMNYPTADDDNSPRKIWLEIDSQVLNSLFCVTAFGLAPWRFRDLYYHIRVVHWHDRAALAKLAEQNKSWFRQPAWADEADGAEEGRRVVGTDERSRAPERRATFTGKRAPPTPLWKLGFNVWMMVLNTLLQVVLCYFMWAYNRLNRPSWATGTFIGLGCGVAMFAGVMSWWEGRKVKKIEGPEVRIVEKV